MLELPLSSLPLGCGIVMGWNEGGNDSDGCGRVVEPPRICCSLKRYRLGGCSIIIVVS